MIVSVASYISRLTSAMARFCCLFILFSFFFSSCKEAKDRVIVDGEISGIKQADFYVYNEEGILGKIDTIHILDGRFHYEKVLKEPLVLTFLYPNFSRTYFIAEPGKKLKVRGEASKLSALDVSGSKENELLTKFRQQNVAKSAEEVAMAAGQFVRDNSKTRAAVAVYKRYFAMSELHEGDVALPLLEYLQKQQPKNKEVELMVEWLHSQMKTAIGGQLPDFTAVTLQGDTITQDTFKDKPLLVVFWSTWCNESYQLMKTLGDIEHKYHGKLNILSLSVDYNVNASRNRITMEDMRSYAVCDGKAFSSPLVQTFGVRYVPGNIFVNKNGKIQKRDVPVGELQKHVASWLK